MPSYRDGRLCCDSAEQCAKLNKNYPLCSELTAKADYTSGAECTSGGGFSQMTTSNNKLDTTLDRNLNANPSDNIKVGNTNTGPIKTYSGNDKCQWENMPCNHSAGGGGGGGHIGDDCGSKTTRYMSADLTQTAYVTVDTCTGERWASSSSF